MITSFLQGGLGNQMFQIAAAMCLAKKYNDVAVFNADTHFLPKQGRKVDNYKDNIFRNINFSSDISVHRVYHEPYFHHCEIGYGQNLCLNGYFQSEKYFIEHEDYIKDVFSPDEQTMKTITGKYGDVLGQNTVALHVRRGDYLNHEQQHPVCSVEYYKEAMTHFPEDSIFLIVSDDIDWCKTVFSGNNFIFIENNEDYVDLYLITLCNGVIMSNSSFSWWGAWMNKNKDKTIVAPKRWFGPAVNYDLRDLIPSEWRIV